MNNSNSEFKDFLGMFWPVLLSFVSVRLMTQTDLLFIAQLGLDETAAYAVPSRVMLFDILVAFAIAPAVSVLIAKGKKAGHFAENVRFSLQLSLMLALGLVAFGLSFYPKILQLMDLPPQVRPLALEAVYWMTASIPVRLLLFVGTMALHGQGLGRKVVTISLWSVAANAILDYLFIVYWGLGFSGSYITTVLISFVQMIWSLGILLKIDHGVIFGERVPQKWARDFFSLAWPEGLRVFSERLYDLTALWVIALLGSASVLGAFSVGTEFLLLCSMPLIALMRAVAIYFARSQSALDVFSIGWRLLPFVIGISLLLLGSSGWLGSFAYNLGPEPLRYWNQFAVLMALGLPILLFEFLLRGDWQAREKLKELSRIDLFSTWLVGAPVFFLGYYLGEMWVLWLGIFAPRFSTGFILLRKRVQLLPRQHTK